MLRTTTRAWGKCWGLAAWIAVCGGLAGCKTGEAKVGDVIDADPPTLGDAAPAPGNDDAGAPPMGGGGGAGAPGPSPATPAGTARKIPTHGSAIAITADDKWAVAANRTAG